MMMMMMSALSDVTASCVLLKNQSLEPKEFRICAGLSDDHQTINLKMGEVIINWIRLCRRHDMSESGPIAITVARAPCEIRSAWSAWRSMRVGRRADLVLLPYCFTSIFFLPLHFSAAASSLIYTRSRKNWVKISPHRRNRAMRAADMVNIRQPVSKPASRPVSKQSSMEKPATATNMSDLSFINILKCCCCCCLFFFFTFNILSLL